MNYTLEQQKLRQAADESGGEINKHIHKLQQKCVWWEGGGRWWCWVGKQKNKKQTKMAQTEIKIKTIIRHNLIYIMTVSSGGVCKVK